MAHDSATTAYIMAYLLKLHFAKIMEHTTHILSSGHWLFDLMCLMLTAITCFTQNGKILLCAYASLLRSTLHHYPTMPQKITNKSKENRPIESCPIDGAVDLRQ